LLSVSQIKSKHQGLTVEKSSAQKPNQGVCTDVSKDHPCLIFFGYFLLSRNAKRSSRQLKDIVSEIKESDKKHLTRNLLFKKFKQLYSNIK
jgi:hypothetical protein